MPREDLERFEDDRYWPGDEPEERKTRNFPQNEWDIPENEEQQDADD